MRLKTIEWIGVNANQLIPGFIKMIDQTRLPTDLVYLETDQVEQVWEAIKVLRVRGAPAIGIAAAMGVAAVAQQVDTEDAAAIISRVDEVVEYLATSRPTAVNLFWALNRMKTVAHAAAELKAGELKEKLVVEAMTIRDEDAEMCRAIGHHGVTLLKDRQCILTHCNAGSLATAQYGTALAPIYVAREQGMHIRVFVDETRPLLQGARLTAWELMQEDIDVTLICDNMAAQVMREGRIDAVLVGADRIAANGDAANKIGTYGVALLARAHNIPFYVLAPHSTFDLSLDHGDKIPIEEREPVEVTEGFGRRTAPADVKVYAPAFDVTPAELISAIVCEKGILNPPYKENISRLLSV